MTPAVRVAAFVALLVVVFAAATLAGAAIDPEGGDGGTHADGAGTAAADDAHSDGGAHEGSATPAALASSQAGYRLVVARTRFAAGRAAPLTFRILDADGKAVRDFDVEQARKMHVVVVRRDLRRYRHLHPVQARDGAWTTPLTLPEAGVYRAFADFKIDGDRHTLGADLFVPGDFAPRELPAPARTAAVDGYAVALHEHDGEAAFFVRRAGKLVTDLQPYLGARGHLVAIRDGDLAYEHVHPEPGPPPEVTFELGRAEPGAYRLFLQFRHGGRVHTAAFTRVVRP